MAGILKVDKYQDFNGNDIMTSDGAGNITMPSGIISGQNYPAFQAEFTSSQSVSNASSTKIQFNSEIYDTDGCYDNSSNYRFTPTESGKYLVYAYFAWDSTSDFDDASIQIYKNGSSVALSISRNEFYETQLVTKVVEFNGTSDYIEIYGYQESGGSVSPRTSANTNGFGAYRIGA
jgi:hypothetical protein